MPTSWMPELVKTVTWLWSLWTTLMSISLRELIDIAIALVEQIGGRGVVGLAVAELLIDAARCCCIASLACFTASASPVRRRRAAPGRCAVMPLSCCGQHLRGTRCTALRAEAESRAGRQRLQRRGEIVVDAFRASSRCQAGRRALQPVIELRAQIGIAGAGAFHPHLPLDVLIELAIDRGTLTPTPTVAGGGRDLVDRLADVARRIRHSPRWRRRATARPGWRAVR